MTGDILTQRLDSILSLLETSVKTAGSFAVEQAPDVVRQLLVWQFTISLIGFVFGIVLFAAGLIATWKIFAYFYKINKNTYAEGTEAFSLFLLCIPAVGFCFIIENLDWLQIWIAPKLYLLEYASSLLK